MFSVHTFARTNPNSIQLRCRFGFDVSWTGFRPSWTILYTVRMVSCLYSTVQLITILAEIRSVGLMCEIIRMVLIQELQEFQPFYLMKWVWTKLNNTFHQESWSTHFAWNSNTFYSSHCTVVLNQTWWSLILVFCWDLWSTHFAWNSFTAVYSSLCTLCVYVISCV